jgi:hypothetical protein
MGLETLYQLDWLPNSVVGKTPWNLLHPSN